MLCHTAYLQEEPCEALQCDDKLRLLVPQTIAAVRTRQLRAEIGL